MTENGNDIKWSSHFKVSQAPNNLEHGDKIILPASALEQLLEQSNTLPSPLTFELRHPHSGAIIHGGVKEFTSSDNVQLPAWMLNALKLQLNDHVVIRLCSLPKGSWTQLIPLSADYREIIDYRAALEAHLRGNYTALSKGQILSCYYGGQTYDFKVEQLKPQDAVSITDTDLEVDLLPINEQDQVIRRKNSTVHEIVQLDQTVDAQIEPNAYTYWKLDMSQANTDAIDIELKVLDGDADVVISGTDRSPTLENHEWADLTFGKERAVNISGISTGFLHVGVHGYNKQTTVAWKASKSSGITATAKNEDMDVDTEGKVQCENCNAWVLERTLPLHQGFCLRNNVLCPWGCQQVFKKGSEELEQHWHCDQCDKVGNNIEEREKHMDYCHTQKSCICNVFTTDSYEKMAEHRRTICSEKMITCRYCHILTSQGALSLDARDRLLGLHSHESYCGSRTITCQKCNKQIPIKDIQVHAKIHEVKQQQQTLPPNCCNRNCIRQRAKNRLSFCQFCFGPFWITEDDPKNAKLIQRLARKIHAQFTIGCGNNWCRNPYCATFTKDPKDATTAASLLIPMIKPLGRQLLLPNPEPDLYLCVDETTTRKKFLAQMLEENTQGKYDLEWCVKALEQENEDLNQSQTWLGRNAPSKRKNPIVKA